MNRDFPCTIITEMKTKEERIPKKKIPLNKYLQFVQYIKEFIY